MEQLRAELIYLGFAVICSAALSALGASVVMPRKSRFDAAPWHEKARMLWPARMTANLNAITAPLLFAIIPYWIKPAHYKTLLHPGVIWVCCFFCTIYAGHLITRRYAPERFGFVEFWKRWTCEVTIFGAAYVIAIASCLWSEQEWTLRSTIQLFIVLALFAMQVFGFHFRVLRKLGLVTPGPDDLRNLVEKCARDANIRPPETIVVRMVSANAFAQPFTRQIGFADRTLRALSEEGIAAICRHEIAHLTEPLATHLTRLVFIPFLLPLALARPILGSLGFIAWTIIFAMGWALMGLAQKWFRKMEQRADTHAAQAAEGDAQKSAEREYCRALERLHEVNLIPAVLRKAKTHPHLYDRMVAVGVQPDYARPSAPPESASSVVMITTVVIVVLLALRQNWAPW